jgi:hypothetical protein
MPDGTGQYRTEGTSSLSRMWGALAYEIKMYFAMRATHGNPSTSLLLSGFIGNAIAESAILHARILCDLFSSESKRWEDDIGFSDLFDDWETAGERYSNLKGHIAEMEIAYGDYKTENSACWQFNKMLAHLTKERGFRHIYEDALRKVEPFIRSIVSELECLKPGFFEHGM